MGDLPPGLAAFRAKAKANAAVSTVPQPNPEPVQPSRSRDASPVRPEPVAPVVDPSKWQLDDTEEQYGAIWSSRLKRYLSEPVKLKVGESIQFELTRFFPHIRGFVTLKAATAEQEALELRDVKTNECISKLDMARYNSRVDIAWRIIRKKKNLGNDDETTPDQGVNDVEENGDDGEEDEDARRGEDTLEQFYEHLKSKDAYMNSEDKIWRTHFIVDNDPRGNGRKALRMDTVQIKLRKYSKKKAKKEQEALDWEVRKLKQATNIPSSLFYKQVQALAGQPRTRRSRFAVSLPDGDDSDAIEDEEGDSFEAEDEDN